MCLSYIGEQLTANEDIVCYKWVNAKFAIDPVVNKLHGHKFTGVIKSFHISGVISINDDTVFLCTNNAKFNGRAANDRMGYAYSWAFDSNVRSLLIDGREYIKLMVMRTPYMDMPVKFNQLYTSELDVRTGFHGAEVEKGLHSFADAASADYDMIPSNENIVQCVIPKGSKYYVGSFRGKLSYASDQLMYIKFLDDVPNS